MRDKRRLQRPLRVVGHLAALLDPLEADLRRLVQALFERDVIAQGEVVVVDLPDGVDAVADHFTRPAAGRARRRAAGCPHVLRFLSSPVFVWFSGIALNHVLREHVEFMKELPLPDAGVATPFRPLLQFFVTLHHIPFLQDPLEFVISIR